jgi:Trypsin-like peptidase domain
MKKIALSLSVTLLLFSCGKNIQAKKKITSSGVIVGNLDWEELKPQLENTPFSTNTRAVGIMVINEKEQCTGFLVSKDIVMTNQHCIPDARSAKGTTITFGHDYEAPESDYITYQCDEFIMANEKLDFALVRCAPEHGKLPGERFGTVSLEKSEEKFKGEIYVIQQNCQYFENRNCDPSKKIAYGKILSEETSGDLIHDADTLGGSSGSPVFSKDNNKVVALHHLGINPGRNGSGLYNTAVPMSAITSFIEKHSNESLLEPIKPAPIIEPVITVAPVIEPPVDISPLVPGNSIKMAMSLERGKTFGSFQIKKAGEKHFFKITVKSTSNTILKVSLKGDSRSGNLDLFLLDESGKEMVKSTFNSSVETVRILNKEGIYYIQVAGFGGAVGSYKLEIN